MCRKVYYDRDIELTENKDHTKFYCNGQEIKDNDNDNVTAEQEFILKLKSASSKILNRNYKHIIILFGAGASVVPKSASDSNPDKNYGKVVSMIANDVLKELGDSNTNRNNSFYSLEKLSELVNYPGKKITLENGSINSQVFDLEKFISKLQMTVSLNNNKRDQKKLQGSLNKIKDIITDDVTYSGESSKFNHAQVLNLMNERLSTKEKLCAVTTNYDTVIEDQALNTGFLVVDGFSYSRYPEFDDDLFDWNFVKTVPFVSTNELIYKDKVLDLLKIHGSIDWFRCKNKIIRTKNSDSDSRVMIFPSSNKYMQSYQEPYFELMSRFQGKLKQANTLLLTIGFSFSDDHIAQMVIQALKHNTSLSCLVTDYNISPEDNKNFDELVKLKDELGTVAFLGKSLNAEDSLVNYLGVDDEN